MKTPEEIQNRLLEITKRCMRLKVRIYQALEEQDLPAAMRISEKLVAAKSNAALLIWVLKNHVK